MAECRCDHEAWHCLAGHHHAVPSLAAACTTRLEQATRPMREVA